jgi:hypothetical protein
MLPMDDLHGHTEVGLPIFIALKHVTSCIDKTKDVVQIRLRLLRLLPWKSWRERSDIF